MIRTVTLNTGFDETLLVTEPDRGGVGEILDRCVIPSGKGVNCARVVRALGQPVIAYGLVGTDEREKFIDALHGEGVDSRLVPVAGRTRTNFTVRANQGRMATHYRAAGFVLDNEAPIDEIICLLTNDIEPGDVVSLHGSIPNGASDEAWRRVGDLARLKGATLLIDTYGQPLIRVLEVGGILACKPNEDEILALPGIADLAVDTRPQAAVRLLTSLGVVLPIVSIGDQGLVFATRGCLWAARLSTDSARVRVGAGDAALAALAVALGSGETDAHELVRAAISTAVAHVEATHPSALRARAAALAPRVQFEKLS